MLIIKEKDDFKMIVVYFLLYIIGGYLALGLLSFLFIWAYYKLNNFYMGGGGWVQIYPMWFMYLLGLALWPLNLRSFIYDWKERRKRRREALIRLKNKY